MATIGKKPTLMGALCDAVSTENIIAIGDGVLCEQLVDGLRPIRTRIEGVVASSPAMANQLKAARFPVYDFSDVDWIDLFVVSADEVTRQGYMLLGNTAHVAAQKVIAAISKQIVCIAEQPSFVECLGTAPFAVEVIPMARSFVARRLAAMGGNPALGNSRSNASAIIKVRDLDLGDPVTSESQIKLIPGVIDCGLLTQKRADKVVLAADNELQTFSSNAPRGSRNRNASAVDTGRIRH